MRERTVLEVQGLTKRFGGLVAVDALSFAVHDVAEMPRLLAAGHFCSAVWKG